MNGPKPRPAVDRVLARVEKRTDSGCWIFTGALIHNGYGYVGVGSRRDGTSRMALAHRVVYEALVGQIPDGLELDHVKASGCMSRACCNPNHLEPVTRRENLLRGEGLAAKHARQTHCIHGHELAPHNLRATAMGRQCRTCSNIGDADRRRRKREKLAASGVKLNISNKLKTHCPRGHVLAGDNLKRAKMLCGRGRECRICYNEGRLRKRYAAKRAI